MSTSTPPRVRSPKVVQGIGFAAFRRQAMQHWIRSHGRIFEINIPFFGRSVVICDPALVQSVCAAHNEHLANVQPNLSNWFGAGSVFALDGDRHRERRRLLAPGFHGSQLKGYERVFAHETLREIANWPEGQEFRILEPMHRITLNVILRTLFGEGATEVERTALEELRQLVSPYLQLGSVLAFAPAPPEWARRRSPWGTLDRHRKTFDRIVFTLIDHADAEPNPAARNDILAVLRRSTGPDGARLTRQDISDEMLTLIGAGHETTAAALGWAFERLRRHPDVLAELVDEVDAGGSDFRRATIAELLRVRTVIDVAGRRVEAATFDIGPWRIPQGRNVLLRIADLHRNPDAFPHPENFDPHRFHHTKPPAHAWLAFGGGARRCPGADFAQAEMDVVLRTVLQNFRLRTDAADDEPSHFRGVAHTPKLGGRVVLTRRS